MKFLKILTLIFVLFLSEIPAYSSHLMGGEITWVCNGSGEYIFTVKLYRDCGGITAPPSVTLYTDAPGLSAGITCNPTVFTDISPQGPGCPTCANPFSVNVQECIYTSLPIAISGTPPSVGWYFAYADCCRNAAITNLSSSGSGNFILRAVMYSNGTINTNPCYDSSPQFVESPSYLLCNRSQINCSNAAFDPDLDSLTFEWAQPLDGGYFPTSSPYPFNSGYSYSSPLPGPSQNPLNVAATMDPNSGVISFTSFTSGNFISVTKVTSYRCGVKTAEVFREMSFSLINCQIDSITINTAPDLVNSNPIETITILAGDTLIDTTSATDFEFLSASVGGTPQVVTLNAISQHLGLNDTSTTTGCLIPPCATFDPPSPSSSIFSTSGILTFPTSCAHAGFNNGCLQHQRMFSFVYKFQDNFCPANGVVNKILNVYVTGPEIQLSGNDLYVSYPGVSIQWYLNGVLIPGATDTIITPVQNGIYTVIATNSSGCSMISNAVNRVMSGNDDVELNNKSISIYPNPISKGGMLNVVLNGIRLKENLLQVLDINGRLIKQFNFQLNSETEHIVLDVTDISDGVYTLSLKNGSEIISEGFVIK